jgi:hypothetical protein
MPTLPDFYNFIRVHANQDWAGDQIDFRIAHLQTGRKLAVCQPLEFIEIPEGSRVAPAFSLNRVEAQRLMDQLWDCGLRPTQGKGSVGQLEATERHLADVRMLVSNKLGVKL